MWLLECVYALLLVHVAYGASAPFFRKDYDFDTNTQNFYKIHHIGRSWQEAKARCQLEGGNLFVPDSKEDQDAVQNIMQTKLQSYSFAWIGIHDLFSEGDFITIEGVPIEEVYHQWDNWEPNNAGDKEDCVILKKDGKINDEDCTKKYPFVCKKSRASIEWNIFCDMPDLNYQYNRDLGKCYKLHLKPVNWTEAFGVCNAEQSYLAVINSKAESNHLVKMIADAPKNQIHGNYLSGAVHLGFQNLQHEGFTTVQGVKLEDTGYTVWGGGQPDNVAGHEDCGSMFYDGTLNDNWCGSICLFICEHDIAPLNFSIEDRFKDRIDDGISAVYDVKPTVKSDM